MPIEIVRAYLAGAEYATARHPDPTIPDILIIDINTDDTRAAEITAQHAAEDLVPA